MNAMIKTNLIIAIENKKNIMSKTKEMFQINLILMVKLPLTVSWQQQTV